MTSALDLLSSLVLEDGRRWGEVAHPFQWDDARAVLEGDRRYAYLTRPRGASKTTDLGGIGIAALVEQLPAGSRSFAAAADRDQGGLLLDAIAGFVERTPGLDRLLKVDAWKVTARRTGATLEVLAADSASAWGRRPQLLVVDERANWRTTAEPERFWRALFSALPKVPGSRLVILTTAGDPAHPAGRLLERARRSPRWYVSEVPGPSPWADADDLAEQREELPEWEYARLHLNRWTAPADRLTTVGALAACVTLDGDQPHDPFHEPYVVGLDLGVKVDRTAAAVCHLEHREGRRRVVLDRLQVWTPTKGREVQLDAVEDWLVQASQSYGGALAVYDPWQALGLGQRLQGRGVPAVEYPFNPASVARLGLTLHGLIRDGDLALPEDPELLDELANVRLRETSPGVYRMDHDVGRHDDRATALALAAQRLLEFGVIHFPEGWLDGHRTGAGSIMGNLLAQRRRGGRDEWEVGW